MFKVFKIRTKDTTGIACEVLEVFRNHGIDIKDAKILSKEIIVKIDDYCDRSFVGDLYKICDFEDIKELDDYQFCDEKKDNKVRLIGNSDAIKRVRKYIKVAANSTSSVMILGESGTGKEVTAKEIVRLGNRCDRPFLSINCAALPEDLLESELFGYKKGAFTGANIDKKGLFLEANGGTLFLDEVGEMGARMQAKLLRVLQEGKVRRVGSTVEESVDVRIISATNRNLESMVKNGSFRRDLYYRLNVLPIHIPSLNERKEDIELLLKSFISELNEKLDKNIEGYTKKYILKLINLNYEGNIRELKNIVERSMNLASSEILKEEDIVVDTGQDLCYNTDRNIDMQNNCFDISSKKVVDSENIFDNFNLDTNDNLRDEYKSVEEYNLDTHSKSIKGVVGNIEKSIIENALKDIDKSVRCIAKEMNISHTTLINKCKKYHIDYKNRTNLGN